MQKRWSFLLQALGVRGEKMVRGDFKQGIHRVCWQCYRSNKCSNNYLSQKSKNFHEFMQISKGNEHPMRPLQHWADLHCKPLKWHITMKKDKDICCQGMEGERSGGDGWGIASILKKKRRTDVSMPSFVLCHVPKLQQPLDLLHFQMLHFKSHHLWQRSPKPQKSSLWLLLPVIKDSSSILVLLFFIGFWNTTDLVPKPAECCRRIFASLHSLLISAMKMASKQVDACKKKSFINQKILYPA